jgi:hypothetical protein
MIKMQLIVLLTGMEFVTAECWSLSPSRSLATCPTVGGCPR